MGARNDNRERQRSAYFARHAEGTESQAKIDPALGKALLGALQGADQKKVVQAINLQLSNGGVSLKELHAIASGTRLAPTRTLDAINAALESRNQSMGVEQAPAPVEADVSFTASDQSHVTHARGMLVPTVF